MSTTAADILGAIEAGIEALTPAGGQESHKDQFRRVPALNAAMGSRAFVLEVSEYPHPTGPTTRGINPGPAATHKAFILFVGVVYPADEWRRRLSDGEQIAEWLWSAGAHLRATVPGLINVDSVTPLADPLAFPAIDSSMYRVVSYSARVTYDNRTVA
jgi:hypothetical protein